MRQKARQIIRVYTLVTCSLIYAYGNTSTVIPGNLDRTILLFFQNKLSTQLKQLKVEVYLIIALNIQQGPVVLRLVTFNLELGNYLSSNSFLGKGLRF